jgi:hypothetical protein
VNKRVKADMPTINQLIAKPHHDPEEAELGAS